MEKPVKSKTCSICGEKGHNLRTCEKNENKNSSGVSKNTNRNEREHKKKRIIRHLYNKFGHNVEITNEAIKGICDEEGYRNSNDAVKIDYINGLPENLIGKTSLINLGSNEGEHIPTSYDTPHKKEKDIIDKHMFIPYNIYHKKEVINNDEIKTFNINPNFSWDTEFSKSEGTFINILSNSGLLNDYFMSKGYLNVPGRVRGFNFPESNFNGRKIKMGQLQIEIDGLYISNDNEICFPIEMKSYKNSDFNSLQLYYPYKKMKYSQKEKCYPNYGIYPTYIVKGINEEWVELYTYDFKNDDLFSMYVIQKAKYNLNWE